MTSDHKTRLATTQAALKRIAENEARHAAERAIAKGIWYRRRDGGMYAATLRDDERVRFIALHPNTLEEVGRPKFLSVEDFYSRYCRRDQL
jgi:hypothetical protein